MERASQKALEQSNKNPPEVRDPCNQTVSKVCNPRNKNYNPETRRIQHHPQTLQINSINYPKIGQSGPFLRTKKETFIYTLRRWMRLAIRIRIGCGGGGWLNTHVTTYVTHHHLQVRPGPRVGRAARSLGRKDTFIYPSTLEGAGCSDRV